MGINNNIIINVDDLKSFAIKSMFELTTEYKRERKFSFLWQLHLYGRSDDDDDDQSKLTDISFRRNQLHIPHHKYLHQRWVYLSSGSVPIKASKQISIGSQSD